MKAVLLSLALFLSTASFSQQQVYSANVHEWYASPTREYFVFQEETSCTMNIIPADRRKELQGGYLRYLGKTQKLCWTRDDMSFFGVRDDGSYFKIPWWFVFPRRMV